jgi:lipopolysaccharide export system protein LptA
MNWIKYFFSLSFLLIFSGSCLLLAQEIPINAPGGDSVRRIEILDHTRELTIKTIDDTTKLTILSGNVKLRQGTTLFYCDSCVLNNNKNTFEAWGRVHINDADTINIYSNHLRYLGREKMAYLDGNVRLTDGKGTLTTPDLEYNMETNIGIYKKGGRVVNKKTVLTSQEGVYYADLKDIYFIKNVILKDTAYNITTDSLLYNTETQTTRFVSQTTITDSNGRTIKTKEGYINQQTGMAEFGQRPEIKDGDITIRANTVTINDSTGISIALGNAVITNEKDKQTIIAGKVERNKNTESFLATRKPLMILQQDDDSIYISADTLFMARLTDRFGNPDSVIMDTLKRIKAARFNESDSSNRYFEAYRNVRIFNDSMQAVCDSMFYSFRDSVFRLYNDPVIWAQKSQITGDTILLYTKNKKADKMEAYENGFLVNELDPGVYNQIKASRLDGWFIDGGIDSVRALGLAECVYYLQDEDSAYSGVNQSTCDIIDIYFANKELDKVVFRSEVNGTIWPIRQKSPSEMLLSNFRWLEERRPKSKLEMME